MASKQAFSNIAQCTDILSEHSKNLHSSPLHSISATSNFNNISYNTQVRKKDKDTHALKKTRRRPRYKKSKEKMQNEEHSLRHSFSSSSSISSSPLNSVSSTIRNIQKRSELCESPGIITSNSKVIAITYSIKAVTDDKNGTFIKKRNLSDKFINLRSFTNTIHCPILFISAGFTTLSVTGEIDKAKYRKYPLKESRKDRKKKQQDKEADKFENYIQKSIAQEGLSNGTFIKGFIRINPKNPQQSYVNNQDSSISDYCLTSITDRNRALEGDEVVLQIIPDKEGSTENKTAKVVYIIQKVHTRQSVGVLKPLEEDPTNILFVPRDKRFPIMKIPELQWPIGFKEQPEAFNNILFVGQVAEWIIPCCAEGILIDNLGQSGDLKIESLSILKENSLDITPFSKELKKCLPNLKVIPEKEFEYREDLREKCIFTIDPATARDLDDAVSVERLPNGNFEVGVHISDISYYLEEGTPLDQAVSKKATTIYLVDNVYHMVPDELCLASSLLPGEDKLSFSVFWEMTETGEILDIRFVRSIINSCVKLAYEHAQMIIENPDKEFTSDDFPPIFNNFQPQDIINTVNILQSLAVIFKENRVRNGALKIDNTKLLFSLNPVTGEPLEFFVYENKEANFLIEEFMLLANISVAQKIHEHFPEIAFLRKHEAPKMNMLSSVQETLTEYGIHLNISSSGDLARSIKKYISNDYEGYTRAVVLNHLISKPMVRAQYFCSGSKNNEESQSGFDHYALSIPIYTHFTSPIRRYADIMVHRLLAACLNYTDMPTWDTGYVEAIANNCNIQKFNAKKAGDSSIALYLAHYIEKNKPFKQECVVVDVKEKKFDVIVLKTGSVIRIYPNNCERGTIWKYEPNKLTITFPQREGLQKVTITVELFSLVKINVKRKDFYNLEGFLLRPMPKRTRNRPKKKLSKSTK